MTFTVTYRAKDGALHEECVEAASRADCVAACRRRGIAPTKIREGGRASSRAATAGAPRRGDRPGRAALVAAAVLIVVAIVGGVWWWCGHAGRVTLPVEKPAKPKAAARPEAAPYQTPAKPKAEARGDTAARGDARPPAGAEKPATNAPSEVVWRQVTTNSSGVVTEKFRTADGKSHRVITHPRRVFDNPSDQLIAMALSASKQGGPMPPLPLTDATEKDFLESLTHPIAVSDDDPPDVKELKREVAAVRKELIELVKGGMTVRQALQEHQKNVNDNAALRDDAMKKLSEVRAEGDKEMAEEFKKKVNQELDKRGIAPLK